MTGTNWTAPYSVACCVYNAVADALIEAGLRVPERGGVTHKLDGDWECEDCESLWVWWSDTANPTGEIKPGCRIQYERTYTILLAWNVCTERMDPCSYDPNAPAGKCGDENEDGCADVPTPQIGEGGKCVDNDGLTVGSEAAWIWAARYAIERLVPHNLACCLRECASTPQGCTPTSLQLVNSDVEGGCSFTQFSVRFRW